MCFSQQQHYNSSFKCTKKEQIGGQISTFTSSCTHKTKERTQKYTKSKTQITVTAKSRSEIIAHNLSVTAIR